MYISIICIINNMKYNITGFPCAWFLWIVSLYPAPLYIPKGTKGNFLE